MARARREDRKCEHCGSMFHPREKASRFCATACWYASREKARHFPCECCGTPFDRRIKTQRACSHECASKLKMANREVSCKQCGVVFTRPHGKKQVYCSRACSMVARNAVSTVAKPIGSTHKHAGGYITQKTESGWVMQHRLVMEEMIGRPLMQSERVHHRNSKRDDNRPENLELWTGIGESKKDPHGVRVVDKVLDLLGSLTKAEREKVARRLEELNNG